MPEYREQNQDEELADLIKYLEHKVVLECTVRKQKVLTLAQRGYYAIDGVLYYESTEIPNRHRLVVPVHLHQQIVDENHDPIFAGHFLERKMLEKLKRLYFRYALVFQDYLTKWPEVYPVVDKSASTVARCLVDLICKHGVFVKIIHDRAAEFLSNIVQETATLLGITQLPGKNEQDFETDAG